jgi:uncharacterized membrane protein YraQ (UPF0718 family)
LSINIVTFLSENYFGGRDQKNKIRESPCDNIVVAKPYFTAKEKLLWYIPIAAVIGIPMYIRAESIIPIGMTLLGKGMAMGTVAALVIGGAGASIPEVTLLASIFKPRLVVTFVITILVIACITGYVFNLVL